MAPRFASLFWIVAGAVLLAAGCATVPAGQARGDEEAVRAVLDGYARAVTTGDRELCMALCAMDSGGEAGAWNGRPTSITTSAILSSKLSVEVSQVGVAGDWSLAKGTYTLAASAAGAVPSSGEFLAVLERKADGNWKITEMRHGAVLRDSFSTNLP